MYVKIMNAVTRDHCMVTVSKLSKISDLKGTIESKMNVDSGSQRLIYQGKILEDDYSIFDYNVQLNDCIQLMVRAPLSDQTNKPVEKEAEKDKKSSVVGHLQVGAEDLNIEEVHNVKVVSDADSEYRKVGERVDCRDEKTGAWFEADIKKITKNDSVQGADNLTYHVLYAGYGETFCDEDLHKVKLEQLRPVSKSVLKFENLELKQDVMINYNIVSPNERGFWYDAVVSQWKCTSKEKKLEVTIFSAVGKTVDNCKILFIEGTDIRKVESVNYDCVKNSSGISGDQELDEVIEVIDEEDKKKCETCQGRRKKCKECGCRKCGGKEDVEGTEMTLILCDECDGAYHIRCLGLGVDLLQSDDEWFCPDCKNDDNIVGGNVKMAKKKVNSNAKWGGGFATAGRTKECTIVPKEHLGPVPGVEVGMSWLMRIQCSEVGVHRPPVAGIAGSEKKGCQSIVLAGGYEDDEDNGDEFTYTGSGGRDLSGNKRTAAQSSDQKLIKSNLAIASNCKAKVNSKGADAGANWKAGEPIRVLRSYKGKKHSDFAPDAGVRYDGIYKVVKYWQATGEAGFKVWRYLLRRDDPVPAPWTEEGIERIEQKGYELVYPDGYLEAQAEKEKEDKKAGKRKKGGSTSTDDEDKEEESEVRPKAKKPKIAFKLSKEWKKLMDADGVNATLWKEVQAKEVSNEKEFCDAVEEALTCMICMDVVFKPVTTPCRHNACLGCLERSFAAETFNCPSCRAELGKEFLKDKKKIVNNDLKKILNEIFPGYEAGR